MARDGTLVSEQLAAATRQYVNTQKEKALIAARLDEVEKVLKSGGNLSGTTDVRQSRLIQELREREIALAQQIEEFKGKYADLYPKIVDARSQMNELRDRISIEINKIAISLRSDYRVQLAAEERLKSQIEELTHSQNLKDLSSISQFLDPTAPRSAMIHLSSRAAKFRRT